MKKKHATFWNQAISKISRFISENKLEILLFLIIFVIFLSSRFYRLEQKTGFEWDQVDNAWVAKNIIVDQKFPLLGMQAKGNSGFYIGPLYYYLVAFVYFLTNLDPIASGILARITAVITFLVLYYVVRKIFDKNVALTALVIYTFSNYALVFDRIQWPVGFVFSISILIFYCLYRIICGSGKYLVLLGIVMGISFHIHFTSIFYPIIAFFCLPLFPRTRNTIFYGAFGLLIFLGFLLPFFIAEASSYGTHAKNFASYGTSYYHGFHIRRLLQLFFDAFIEFEGITKIDVIKRFGALIYLIFAYLLYKSKKFKEWKVMIYLSGLWILVPWIVFTTYSGEISNYYFSMVRFIAVTSFAYIAVAILSARKTFLTVALLIFTFFWGYNNMYTFINENEKGLAYYKKIVKEEIANGRTIKFSEGDPRAYLYYIYKERISK